MISCLHHKPLQTPNTPSPSLPSTLPSSQVSFLQNQSKCSGISRLTIPKKRRAEVVCSIWLLPVDAWQPNIDSESIAPQLFAFSLFPYLGFLYFITKSKSAPNLTLFGFYFLLAFVGATIPAGIYAKVHYGTSLSNVDWLHGGAESLLTLTNLFIVLGLRQALRNASDAEKRTSSDAEKRTSDTAPMIKEKK